MDNMVYIVAGIVASLLVVRHLATRQGRAKSSEPQRHSDDLQSYLAACVNDLRNVLAQTGKDPETIRREANEILARMESRNTEGSLDEFIRDNRESVDIQLESGD